MLQLLVVQHFMQLGHQQRRRLRQMLQLKLATLAPLLLSLAGIASIASAATTLHRTTSPATHAASAALDVISAPQLPSATQQQALAGPNGAPRQASSQLPVRAASSADYPVPVITVSSTGIPLPDHIGWQQLNREPRWCAHACFLLPHVPACSCLEARQVQSKGACASACMHAPYWQVHAREHACMLLPRNRHSTTHSMLIPVSAGSCPPTGGAPMDGLLFNLLIPVCGTPTCTTEAVTCCASLTLHAPR